MQELIARRVARLGARLAKADRSLVLAESCTGGALAAAIIADPEASPMLERGLVVYSNAAKCELLGLDAEEVEACDGVSEDIARAMARAALANSHADVAAAITGFAGPRQGDEEVGLVHVAAATPQGEWHRAMHLGDIGRGGVCDRAISETLDLLLKVPIAR